MNFLFQVLCQGFMFLCRRLSVLVLAPYSLLFMRIMQGLLQSEVEGADNENVGFYGRCALHAAYPTSESDCDPLCSEIKGENDLNCARTKVFCQLIEVFFYKAEKEREKKEGGGGGHCYTF